MHLIMIQAARIVDYSQDQENAAGQGEEGSGIDEEAPVAMQPVSGLAGSGSSGWIVDMIVDIILNVIPRSSLRLG